MNWLVETRVFKKRVVSIFMPEVIKSNANQTIEIANY
jgi:hypothetical protein